MNDNKQYNDQHIRRAVVKYNDPFQLYLFDEAKPEPRGTGDSVILFHLPKSLKDSLIKNVALHNLSITGILNNLITDYLDGLKVLLKPKKKTGRGNRDEGQIEKVKEFLRKQHPYPVRQNEVARFVGCEQARAGRLLDLLSGVSGDKNNAFDSTDFLVGVNDERKPITYFIFKDRELGIEP